MSLRVWKYVFDHYPVGGNELLVALSLADWADDSGENIRPTIKALAHKARVSERTAQRMIYSMIQRGWLEMVSKESAAEKKAREYRMIGYKQSGDLFGGKPYRLQPEQKPEESLPDGCQTVTPDGCQAVTPVAQVIEIGTGDKLSPVTQVSPYTVNNSNSISSEQGCQIVTPDDIPAILLSDGTEYRLEPEQVMGLQKLYPTVNVMDCVRDIAARYMMLPIDQRKDGLRIRTYLTNWIRTEVENKKSPAGATGDFSEQQRKGARTVYAENQRRDKRVSSADRVREKAEQRVRERAKAGKGYEPVDF